MLRSLTTTRLERDAAIHRSRRRSSAFAIRYSPVCGVSTAARGRERAGGKVISRHARLPGRMTDHELLNTATPTVSRTRYRTVSGPVVFSCTAPRGAGDESPPRRGAAGGAPQCTNYAAPAAGSTPHWSINWVCKARRLHAETSRNEDREITTVAADPPRRRGPATGRPQAGRARGCVPKRKL